MLNAFISAGKCVMSLRRPIMSVVSLRLLRGVLPKDKQLPLVGDPFSLQY